MRPSLTRLTIRGFKTIRELKDFEPGRITVLIGPNGAGKSNLLSFFRMLSRILTPPGGLQLSVAEQGGASSLLHDGPSKTQDIDAALSFQSGDESFEYIFRLFYTDGDTLAFGHERYTYSRLGADRPATPLGGAHREPRLVSEAEGGSAAARAICGALRRMIVHQFIDTSTTSRIRNKWSVDDGGRLKEDAGNLAPFLYRLQQIRPKYYRRIVETIRLILPFFADFEFQPEYGSLLLRWLERGSDRVFSVSQAADGMLRAMALVALLQQPEEDLPDVLILDEPELALHPYAIEVLAALLQSASHHVQVIVATQSVSLIDRLEPHDIVVVDRTGRESMFRRLNDDELTEWREQCTLCVASGDPFRQVECLEQRLHHDLAHRQFIPYIQLHEFEALLFSEPRQFEIAFPGDTRAIDQLVAIRNEFRTPEHIDDRPDLAPLEADPDAFAGLLENRGRTNHPQADRAGNSAPGVSALQPVDREDRERRTRVADTTAKSQVPCALRHVKAPPSDGLRRDAARLLLARLVRELLPKTRDPGASGKTAVAGRGAEVERSGRGGVGASAPGHRGPGSRAWRLAAARPTVPVVFPLAPFRSTLEAGLFQAGTRFSLERRHPAEFAENKHFTTLDSWH